MSDDTRTANVASPTSLPIFQRNSSSHQARSLGGSMGDGATGGRPVGEGSARPDPAPQASTHSEAPSPERIADLREALDRLAGVDWDVVAKLRLDVSTEIAARFPNTP